MERVRTALEYSQSLGQLSRQSRRLFFNRGRMARAIRNQNTHGSNQKLISDRRAPARRDSYGARSYRFEYSQSLGQLSRQSCRLFFNRGRIARAIRNQNTHGSNQKLLPARCDCMSAFVRLYAQPISATSPARAKS
jgi:hypothetical protein